MKLAVFLAVAASAAPQAIGMPPATMPLAPSMPMALNAVSSGTNTGSARNDFSAATVIDAHIERKNFVLGR